MFLAGSDVHHAEAVSKEFRDDVAVARKGEAPLQQIAKVFGISEGCLHNRLKRADFEAVATTLEAQLRV